MARRKTIQKSIQATSKKSRKSSTARLQAETVAKATRNGLPWEDGEVEAIAKMIEKDETTYDMAISLGRTYYSTQYARSHVGFAMRHANVFRKFIR